ncbi:MAG: hypothetical protein Ta2B_27900 [Termitinemataceae bacterium]|nr:MAG: hypothetical protein Ta2B_27900 [Termitinemataceae bacterium]
MNNFSIFRFCVLGIFGFIAAIAAFSVAVMFLWNELVPPIFGLSAINYLQAAGLTILCRILFGGIGFGFGHRGAGMRGYGNPLREKWMNMSPEKRAEFAEKMRSLHGAGYRSDARFDEFRNFYDNDKQDDNDKKNNG